MQELTPVEMADVHGTFWKGFLCGAGIIASIAVSASPDPIARWSIYSGTVAAYGMSFFFLVVVTGLGDDRRPARPSLRRVQ
jgi:hypothetical protein